MPKKRKKHGDEWQAPIDYIDRFRNAHICPIPHYRSIRGPHETDKYGAKYFPAPEYLDLAMAKRKDYKDTELDTRIHIKDTLKLYHRVNFDEYPDRVVFWVKFDKTDGKHGRPIVPRLRGVVTLHSGTGERRGKIHYVTRRPELRLTAVVVVDF